MLFRSGNGAGVASSIGASVVAGNGADVMGAFVVAGVVAGNGAGVVAGIGAGVAGIIGISVVAGIGAGVIGATVVGGVVAGAVGVAPPLRANRMAAVVESQTSCR